MKKITLFVLSIVALASAASAQSVVTEQQFTSNPGNYNDQTLTFNVTVRPKVAISAPTVGAPAVVTTGSGSSANTVKSCSNAPKDYQFIDVDFATAPTFAACFIMKTTDFNSNALSGQESVSASITFKGRSTTMYTISLFTKK